MSLPAIAVISNSREVRDSDSEDCSPYCAYVASHGGLENPVVRTVVDILCIGMVLPPYLHPVSSNPPQLMGSNIRLRSCLCGRVSDCTPHL